jgi:O-antigen/teichoic acid export membrane protein
MGLINRAQALFQGTLGRFSGLVMGSAYLVLPRLAANPTEYPRQASTFFQTALLGLIPGGCFVALEGPQLSRLLYGYKWVAADPLLVPGTMAGMLAVILLVAKNILLAANKLRACYVVNAVAAACAVIPVVITKFGAGAVTYIWIVVAFQCVAFAISMIAARSLLTRAAALGFIPPACAAGLGALGVFLSRKLLVHLPLAGQLTFDALLYGLIMVAVLRFVFPQALLGMLRYLPGGGTIRAGLAAELVHHG